jgi:NarL family two-component system response regulator LiaR
MTMPRSDTVRLLIVDDHKVVRNGLRVFISLYDEIEVVGEAKDGQQALEQCAALQPDVVLMDMVMPIMDGPSATRLIRQQFPRVQVLALTSFDEEEIVHRAIEAGAVGYLYKDVEEEELVAAIQSAREGRPVLAPEAIQALMHRSARQEEQATIEPLTKRELEVLNLVAQGLTNPQIAEQLVISPSTAQFHVHNILGKLGVQTRTEAVTKAIQTKLIEP